MLNVELRSIQHSSFIIHHSSFIIHHSSFIIHHSSLSIQHSPLSSAIKGNKSADVLYGPRVQHVPRFHPSPPGGSHPELHLPIEQARAVAVAIDRHSDARRNRGARVLAVEIQV